MRNMKKSPLLLAISPWPLATCATPQCVQKVAKGQQLRANSLTIPDCRLWTNRLRATKRWTILLGLIGLLITAGCDDYLDENPDNRVELNTLDKAAQLLTNAYPEAGYNFVEWMGDQVSYTVGTRKQRNQLRIYNWEVVNANPTDQDTPEFYWNAAYTAIAHANEVLAVIDQLPNEDLKGDESERGEVRRQAIKGEALLARAYAHFMLVNLFAKHYDPNTATSDLGIPYVTTPETEFIKEYSRASVARVYDLVEQDMLEGLSLVNGSFYNDSGKYHFTRESALAFASRFYLFKYDYNECIKYSNELLGSTPEVYVKDIPALLQQRINTEDYIRLYTAPTDPSNLLLIRQESVFYSVLGFYPNNTLWNDLFRANPFGATDLRENPAYVMGEDGLLATKFERLFQRTSLTSNTGFPYTIFMAFRGEEVLLNRAESYTALGLLNEALADLQTLTDKRFDETVTLDEAAIRSFYRAPDADFRNLIFDYIISYERPKEFVHEGLRWFDIKRYGLEVTHAFPDGSTIMLAGDDNRKVLQIPQAAQDIGGLRPNPR